MRFIIVSGLSGAGKSVALHALEDIGFQCIDNLPVALLETLIEQIVSLPESGTQNKNIAVSIDIRMLSQTTSHRVKSLILKLRDSGAETDIVFLSADDDVLIRRYREASRAHPLAADKRTIEETIALEKDRLDELSMLATHPIDTSSFNLYQLREVIFEWLNHKADGLLVTLQSFAYKKGTLRNADYVFDVRCLDNPYWRLNLRGLSGLDSEVVDFLNKRRRSRDMVEDICGFLKRWLPQINTSYRSALMVAIGCTGGRHRSVYVVEQLFAALSQRVKGCNFIRRHRDLQAADTATTNHGRCPDTHHP